MKKISRRPISLSAALANSDLNPILKKIYASRGIESLEEIDYSLNQLLSFPSLKDIDLALDGLLEALHKDQRILIVGDFDADGATSTVLLISALKAFGYKNLSYFIPNRFEFGYGLSLDVVLFVAEKFKPDLIITVDNGIASYDGVLAAENLGIKVIVTDHHLPSEKLPKALAIVNPNQKDDSFPSKHLAGVGVVFYLCLALRQRLRTIDWFKNFSIIEPNMAQFLDLVALGTIADLVSLDKNNRILVEQGMQRIRNGACRIGIKALFSIASRDFENATASDLGYVVAPRLNAAGRLEDMSIGVECLLASDFKRAQELAKRLNDLNDERRKIEVEMQEEAFTALQKIELSQKLPLGVCLYDPNWHPGVVGILASRIKEKIGRPVIAFAKVSCDELKGSGRSIAGLHLRDVLSNIAACFPSLIDRFGGHAMAAGVTINVSQYEEFSRAFAFEVGKYLKIENLNAEIYTDGELERENISLTMAKLLHEKGPWGQGFPEPTFDGVFTVLQQRLLAGRHLKMTLQLLNERGAIFEAIKFNVDLRRWPNQRCQRVQIAYRLGINDYNDRKFLQLIIEEMREV